jgi:hypothetical protein
MCYFTAQGRAKYKENKKRKEKTNASKSTKLQDRSCAIKSACCESTG